MIYGGTLPKGSPSRDSPCQQRPGAQAPVARPLRRPAAKGRAAREQRSESRRCCLWVLSPEGLGTPDSRNSPTASERAVGQLGTQNSQTQKGSGVGTFTLVSCRVGWSTIEVSHKESTLRVDQPPCRSCRSPWRSRGPSS